jgi:hypothetical protein
MTLNREELYILDFLYHRDYGDITLSKKRYNGYEPVYLTELYWQGFIKSSIKYDDTNCIFFHPFQLDDFTITFKGLWIRYITCIDSYYRYNPS